VPIEVESYLVELVAAARTVLGANLVGAYVGGSVALHAYTAGRSDIDVALVCEHEVALERKQALVCALRHEVVPCPARGLELVGYRGLVAAAGAPDPGFEFELNTGRAMPFRVSHSVAERRPAADGSFWYALDRSILHQSGLALLGAAPRRVFADLPPLQLHGLLVEALDWWLAGPLLGEDAVLTACRSLVKVRNGVWLAKVAAGQQLAAAGWAPELITRSITARAGGQPPGEAEVRAFLTRIRDEIDA
jgi:hypothetical protein